MLRTVLAAILLATLVACSRGNRPTAVALAPSTPAVTVERSSEFQERADRGRIRPLQPPAAPDTRGPVAARPAPQRTTRPPARPVQAAPAPSPSSGWIQATASWYGPGFMGHRTACGQTLTEGLIGVAHKTLPCGTMVTFRSGDRTVTAPVVDRGPYVAGRTFDLTAALCRALAHCWTGSLDYRIGG